MFTALVIALSAIVVVSTFISGVAIADQSGAYINSVQIVSKVDRDGDGYSSDFKLRIRADTSCVGCNDESEDSPDIEPYFQVRAITTDGETYRLGEIDETENNDPAFDRTYSISGDAKETIESLSRQALTIEVELLDSDTLFRERIDEESDRLNFEPPSEDRNSKPEASFEHAPNEPMEGAQVTFDASESADVEGTIAAYEWDFGEDGTADAFGKTVIHTFQESGEHEVELTVEDNVGATTTDSKTLTVFRDIDGDGLTDQNEESIGIDPENEDTDDDGLKDGREVNDLGTDPIKADTDDDGLKDGREVNDLGTDPVKADTDDDGLNDMKEVTELGTDPVKADTDDDELTDPEEFREGTNPTDPDTDGDGLVDIREIEGASNVTHPDTDRDFVPDGPDIVPTSFWIPLGVGHLVGAVVLYALTFYWRGSLVKILWR
jgi:PKD repeat protein